MRYLAALLLIFLATTTLPSFAQVNPGRIVGTVTADNQKTIESATITLLNYKDSSLVKMGVSDQSGTFEFEDLADGKYLVLVSVVGYELHYSPVEIAADAHNIILKTIQLKPNAVSMAGVTVTARRPPIEVKAGKTVVNVANSSIISLNFSACTLFLTK